MLQGAGPSGPVIATLTAVVPPGNSQTDPWIHVSGIASVTYGVPFTYVVDMPNPMNFDNASLTVEADPCENQGGADVTGCLKDSKVEVKSNANGTYTITLSGGSFTGTDITLTSQTAGVTVTPPQQPWAPTTTWTVTGATGGQTIVLQANATNAGHGEAPGTDQCCSGEIKIVLPDCPKQVGEVVVEKKVKNNTNASASVINSLVFPINLTCTPPSNLNTTINLNNGGTHTENNVPYTSVCTVTESTSTLPTVPSDVCPRGTVPVWATPVITPASATINAPVTTFTVVNELDCKRVGELTVKKKVIYDGAVALPSMTFPVTVTCGSTVTQLTLVNGLPQTINNIPLNTSCSVVEGTIPTPPNICQPPLTPVWSTTYVPPSPVIVTGANTTVEIDNTLTCRRVRTCPSPFVIGPDDRCICPPGTHQVGDTCERSPPPICPPPMIPGPVAGQCICPPGTVQQGRECVKHDTCPPPMIPGPVAGQCICPPGTIQQGRECVKHDACPPPKVPGPVAGQCVCPPGTHPVGDTCEGPPPPHCPPPMVPGPLPGHCICPEGTVQKGGSCISPPSCRPPMVQGPVAGQCVCPQGTVQRGRTCVHPPSCNPPARLNRSGQCECPRDMIAVGNMCMPRPRGPHIVPPRDFPQGGPRDFPQGGPRDFPHGGPRDFPGGGPRDNPGLPGGGPKEGPSGPRGAMPGPVEMPGRR